MTKATIAEDLAQLLGKLNKVEFPTLGHYLEDGFCTPDIRPMVAGQRMIGTAFTVRIPDADAAAVNQALIRLQPGDVLVVDMDGDHDHAPIGAVTAASARARGASGILVDGLVTDLDELNATTNGTVPLPVYARGTTCRTTKRKGSDLAEFGVPVTIGGVTVSAGDIVLGDCNGALVVTPQAVEAVVDRAIASDDAEPGILRRIASGEPLEHILYLG